MTTARPAPHGLMRSPATGEADALGLPPANPHVGGSVSARAGEPASTTNPMDHMFRLAPENPHPTQIDDGETAHRWLLSQGYQPRNIGSVGHSIGGAQAGLLPLQERAHPHRLGRWHGVRLS